VPDDDRFADLGSGTRAGDKLADLDRTEPEERQRPTQPPRRGKYTWVVGVAAVIAIAVVTINSGTNPARGSDGPPNGKPLPRWAAPDARSGADLDPNLNQNASDPAPGKTPACEVPPEGAIRSCDYTSKPLVLSFIAPTSACEGFVDRIESLRSRFPGVNFVTVLTASDEDDAAKLVEEHGWEQPVALDRNGTVLTRYRISFCPTVVFAYEGGTVRATKTEANKLSDATLAAEIRATRRPPGKRPPGEREP
jgi:hypothetical protein